MVAKIAIYYLWWCLPKCLPKPKHMVLTRAYLQFILWSRYLFNLRSVIFSTYCRNYNEVGTYIKKTDNIMRIAHKNPNYSRLSGRGASGILNWGMKIEWRGGKRSKWGRLGKLGYSYLIEDINHPTMKIVLLKINN